MRREKEKNWRKRVNDTDNGKRGKIEREKEQKYFWYGVNIISGFPTLPKQVLVNILFYIRKCLNFIA